MLRPYAPNNDPRNYGIVQGSARLLERIWQPAAQYRHNYAAWGMYPREHARAPFGWLPTNEYWQVYDLVSGGNNGTA